MTSRLGVSERGGSSVAEWAQAIVLTANVGWTTLCLGGYRPETMVVTSALTGILLALHFVSCAFDRQARRVHGAVRVWLCFLGYAAINVVLVSPVPWLGWFDWLRWANVIAIVWVVLHGLRSPAPRRMMLFVLVALGVVAVALACYQRFVDPGWLMLGRRQVEQFLGRSSGPFGIPNSLAAWLILLLPITAARALRRDATAMERVWWSWVSAVFLLGLGLTMSRGGWISLSLALIAWPILAGGAKWGRRLATAMFLAVAIVGVAALAFQVSPTLHERFGRLVRDSGELSRPILWRGAWNIFREHPVLGSGAGSFNAVFEQHRPAGFVDDPQWAHNEYLNTLSDYGIVGFGLFFGAAALLAFRGLGADGTRLRTHDTLTRSAPWIGLLAFALQLGVDFHFKIPALGMAFAIVFALALSDHERGDPVDASRRRPFWLVTAAVLAAATFLVMRVYHAEAIRYRARRSLDVVGQERDVGTAAAAETDLRRAVRLSPRNAGAWADFAYALELQAYAAPDRVASLADEAVNAATRATQLAPRMAEFWIRLGVALDMQGRFDAATSAFEHAVALAPKHSHAWYYYAYHLSHDTKQRDAALRAIANCLSLDAGNTAAEALRVKLNDPAPGAFSVP